MIKKVVIAGGGTAGWMACAAINKLIGSRLTEPVTLIESDQIGTVGVGEATIPTLHFFHDLLGINLNNLVHYTDATFKLGIQFENWKQLNENYFHAFGVTGQESWACGFQHFWLKGNQLGVAKEFGDYNLEHRAAMAKQFSHLDNDGLKHAYHLDATKYAKFLRRYCGFFNTNRVEGIIRNVETCPESGFIQSLTMDSGERIEGDLFIDCTGQKGLLISETLGVGFEDWSHWLPCDRAIAVQTKSTAPAVPYTRSIAHESGWQWQIPLQSRVGNGLVYASRHLSSDDAEQLLLENLDGETVTSPRHIAFQTGRRQQQWHKNCVSLGLASGFIEPLESTSIHLIQSGIIRLLRNFPHAGFDEALIRNYNRETVWELERIRDFIILHYKVTERRDSAFWRECADMAIPESLHNKIDAFQKTGNVYRDDGEMFGDSWAQVMLGQGLVPERYHPIIDTLEDRELDTFLRDLDTNIAAKLNTLGEHSEYVRRFSDAAPIKQSNESPRPEEDQSGDTTATSESSSVGQKMPANTR